VKEETANKTGGDQKIEEDKAKQKCEEGIMRKMKCEWTRSKFGLKMLRPI
jgi:hypothetical protein